MFKVKDDFDPVYIPNATTITNKSLETFPNVKYFFECLVKNIEIKTKHVGRSFQYHKDVEKNRYFSAHGLFMDYFIRKQLSNQYDVKITDSRTEHILNNPDDYIISKNVKLRDAIKEHYEIFKDSDTKAIDITKSIKVVSLSHLIFFKDDIPQHEYNVNDDNLREVIRYLKQLPYKIVDLNPELGCQYFNADADLIFDNNVIYEIKTSKFGSLNNRDSKIPKSKFYQTIIYGFGLYKNTGIKVNKFKIYNPLLGDEHSIDLENINFALFEKVLERDVAVFSRMVEIRNEIILDLSLFPGEEDENKNHK